jgi:hypothetical protein
MPNMSNSNNSALKKHGVGTNSTNFMKHILGIDILYVLIGLQHIYPPLPLVTKEIVSFIPHATYLPTFATGYKRNCFIYTTQHKPHSIVAWPSLGHKKSRSGASRATRHRKCAFPSVARGYSRRQVSCPPFVASTLPLSSSPPPRRSSRLSTCSWSLSWSLPILVRGRAVSEELPVW